jgi:hypothetical protein
MFSRQIFLLQDITKNTACLLWIRLTERLIKRFYKLFNRSFITAIEKSSLNKIEYTLGFVLDSTFYFALGYLNFFI